VSPSKPLPATGKARLRRVKFVEADVTIPRVWLARWFAQSKGDWQTLEELIRKGFGQDRRAKR
jgi:hypothetical protein